MNNEINRRDFMKLSVASIMTASVTLNLGNTAFATTASENPKDVLKNFFESFSPTDHESWVNYFASSVYLLLSQKNKQPHTVVHDCYVKSSERIFAT